ncbi:MAG: hypothetical protein LBS00_11260 [Synergistaceae bacterium]|jgi:hypothetical protein|nr:hypothetical protein [Synergistaceae bacterium]
MKNSIGFKARVFLLGAALAFVTLFPAVSAAGTLDALPKWDDPHMIVHLEDVSEAMGRLGSSFFFDHFLDESARERAKDSQDTPFPLRFAREGCLEWLKNFPVESFSLVKGLMLENEDTFQGAIRFASDKQEILDKLSAGVDGDDAEEREKLQADVLDLFGFPPDPNLRLLAFGSSFADSSTSVADKNLYEISLNFDDKYFFAEDAAFFSFYASVEKDGDENILLIGSEPGEVEKAREAVKDEGSRMKITRRGPAGYKNFAQINDTSDGSMTRDILDGLSFEPKAPAFLEFSFGFPEEEIIGAAIRHNLLDVFLGGAGKPSSAWSPDEPGLRFGGGFPWLAGLLSVVMTGDDALGLLATLGGGNKEQAREFLGEQNIDVETLTKAFRSFGFVLGGKSSLLGQEMPGGYAFVSGGAGAMKALLPLIRAFFENVFDFEEAPREGWDVFYALNENLREQLAMPLFAGLKDGTLLLGCLTPETLEENPEIEWPDGSGEDVFRARLNMQSLSLLPIELSTPWLPARLTGMLENLGIEDMLNAQTYSAFLKTLLCAQEIWEITLGMSDWGSLDLTAVTGEVNYWQALELARLARELD